MRGGTGDRLAIVGIWAGAKAVVLLAAVVGLWRAGVTIDAGTFLDAWSQWDTKWFESIAVQGYQDPYLAIDETYRYNIAGSSQSGV